MESFEIWGEWENGGGVVYRVGDLRVGRDGERSIGEGVEWEKDGDL